MTSRRDFLKMSGAAAAALAVSSRFRWLMKAYGAPLIPGLSDPAAQPKFVEYAPNALAPSFIYQPKEDGSYEVVIRQTSQKTGLVNNGGKKLSTTVWGYGTKDDFVSWPGRTFEIQSGKTETRIKWDNQLYKRIGRPLPHLLTVDTSLHWAYSLPGYEHYTVEKDGVPIITHVHGGHTDFQFDGNPEFFYSPNYEIIGPQWYENGLTGIVKEFVYDNDVNAGTLWYHDHALGITRLNVYVGLAGFYIIRDTQDTGKPNNPLGLPAYPYELAYAIQDRMFTYQGEFFYPAYPGDPFYEGFITEEGAILPPVLFPGGGPTALAEFFGDHMVVNGTIWPKEDVEPRNYRMRLLNGTDSRFMVLQFRAVALGATDLSAASAPLPFWVIGSDQGLASRATQVDTLVFEPGGRYDIVFDFSDPTLNGKRVIMANIGGDAPFGGDYGDALAPEDFFPDSQTDRIMAFDVVEPLSNVPDNFDKKLIRSFGGIVGKGKPTVRKVALFEGKDEFGRLQPLLGTYDKVYDNNNQLLSDWKAIAWHSPTTETPKLDTTEIWEVYNFTGDAHPVHLHLVNFEILGRNEITFDSDDGEPGQPVLQHNGLYGVAPAITNVVVERAPVDLGFEDGYVENAPKDMVTALPEQVTRIKATFDKSGRYVWHCHILSHEDHEMMRVLEVIDPK